MREAARPSWAHGTSISTLLVPSELLGVLDATHPFARTPPPVTISGKSLHSATPKGMYIVMYSRPAALFALSRCTGRFDTVL